MEIVFFQHSTKIAIPEFSGIKESVLYASSCARAGASAYARVRDTTEFFIVVENAQIRLFPSIGVLPLILCEQFPRKSFMMLT